MLGSTTQLKNLISAEMLKSLYSPPLGLMFTTPAIIIHIEYSGKGAPWSCAPIACPQFISPLNSELCLSLSYFSWYFTT